MGQTPNDAELVAAARDGDLDAFAALVDRHRPLLRTLCARVLGDPWLVEDATQEAALQAMLGLDRLRRPERFGAWLAGIALNVCRHWVTASGPGPGSWEASAGGQALDPADRQPGPAELAEAADLAARIRRAVADLPRGQRAAILLFYLSGLTHAEIAAQLGIEVSAVKARLHKGRRRLRCALATIWVEERRGVPADRARGPHPSASKNDAPLSSRVARLLGPGGPWLALWTAVPRDLAAVPARREPLVVGAIYLRDSAPVTTVPIVAPGGTVQRE